MEVNIGKWIIVSLLVLFTNNPCYSQKKHHTANYYFQQANIKYQIPPDKYTDSLTKECIDLYTKAIKLNPGFSQAYRNRGRLYFSLKVYKNAIYDLTAAIKYSAPDDKWFLYKLRGQCFYSASEYQKAVADFNRAIPIDGNPTFLYLYRAKAYWKLGLKEKACADYKISFKKDSSVASEREFLDCN